MNELLPRLDPPGSGLSLHAGLVDYVVLEFLERWEAASEDGFGDIFGEKAAQRQKAALLLTTAELARRGLPLELGLEFSDFAHGEADFVRSPAVDGALYVLAQKRLIQLADKGYPMTRLTADGHGLLKVLRGRVQPIDGVLLHLQSAYLLTSDLLRSNTVQPPKHPVRRVVATLVSDLAAKPVEELRDLLAILGVKLARSGSTPRAYRFARSYLVGKSPSEASSSGPRARPKPSSRKEYAY